MDVDLRDEDLLQSLLKHLRSKVKSVRYGDFLLSRCNCNLQVRTNVKSALELKLMIGACFLILHQISNLLVYLHLVEAI